MKDFLDALTEEQLRIITDKYVQSLEKWGYEPGYIIEHIKEETQVNGKNRQK